MVISNPSCLFVSEYKPITKVYFETRFVIIKNRSRRPSSAFLCRVFNRIVSLVCRSSVTTAVLMLSQWARITSKTSSDTTSTDGNSVGGSVGSSMMSYPRCVRKRVECFGNGGCVIPMHRTISLCLFNCVLAERFRCTFHKCIAAVSNVSVGHYDIFCF